ncbi:hypothetical protein BH20ACI3_BH20ACI3_34620 [soil metagenome]
MVLSPGCYLDRYEILSLLGTGGMGEVYLARDTKLDRTLALKILPAEFATDGERMRRFVQEARAAAALNHPHIAHIYEIGEANGTHFIAMEYVNGETLREKIHRDHAPLPKLLTYLTQVAEGLTKAHAAGVVHRDLKPDNIMVTRDGYAKILDFGLAKLVERPERKTDAASSEVVTQLLPQHSLQGMVMGTLGYMSPEQAQGKIKEIDHRSDIFSFGCILYEAATGQRAFDGKDALDSLHKIVYAPTPQIRDVKATAPNELQRIVRRCLAKDAEKRYQAMKDVAIELEELQQELKGIAESEYSVEPALSTGLDLSKSGRADTVSNPQPITGAVQVGTSRSTSSAEYIVGEIKRYKKGAILLVVMFVLGLAGFAFLLSQILGDRTAQGEPTAQPPRAPSREMKIARLTTNGKAQTATISPDGKFLAYVENVGEQQSLWTKQIATNSNVQIVEPAVRSYFGLTFTPDGNYVYYAAKDRSAPVLSIYRVPTLGGTADMILNQGGETITFSPDGRQFAFVRYDGNTTESALMIANADGTGERKLASRLGHEWFTPNGPAWSPDGALIACGIGDDRKDRQMTMAAVNVSDGTLKELTPQRWDNIARATWLTDGRGVVFCGRDSKTDAAQQIWQISYPGGEARGITHDLNSYSDVSITADSNTLVAAQRDLTTGVWVSPNADVNRARQLTSGHSDGAGGVAWTPDGRIVYTSTASGNTEIWIMNQDGTEQQQLTNDSYLKTALAVSPDGRYVIFVSERAGVHLWRINLNGSNATQLTHGNYDSNPCVTPDGQCVVYSSYSSGKLALWKVAVNGGVPVQLTDVASTKPGISPDGKLIVCFFYDTQANNAMRVMVLPFDGGAALRTFDLPQTVYEDSAPRWMPDGRTLTYIDQRGGSLNLWSQPFDGGSPKQLTDFKQGGILLREWSGNGKQVAIVRGASTNNAVLISNFR